MCQVYRISFILFSGKADFYHGQEPYFNLHFVSTKPYPVKVVVTSCSVVQKHLDTSKAAQPVKSDPGLELSCPEESGGKIGASRGSCWGDLIH